MPCIASKANTLHDNPLWLSIGGRVKMLAECIDESVLTVHQNKWNHDRSGLYNEEDLAYYNDPSYQQYLDVTEFPFYQKLVRLLAKGQTSGVDFDNAQVRAKEILGFDDTKDPTMLDQGVHTGMMTCIPSDNCHISIGHAGDFASDWTPGFYGEVNVFRDKDANRKVDFYNLENAWWADFTRIWKDFDVAMPMEHLDEMYHSGAPIRRLFEEDDIVFWNESSASHIHTPEEFSDDGIQKTDIIPGHWDVFKKGQWSNFSGPGQKYWNSSWPQEAEIGVFTPGQYNNSEDYFKRLNWAIDHNDELNPYNIDQNMDIKYYGSGTCSKAVFPGRYEYNQFNDQTPQSGLHTFDPLVSGGYDNRKNFIFENEFVNATDMHYTASPHGTYSNQLQSNRADFSRNICCIPSNQAQRLKRQLAVANSIKGDDGNPRRIAPGQLGGYSCEETVVDPYACVRPVYDKFTKVKLELSDYCCECDDVKINWPVIVPDTCNDWYGTRDCQRLLNDISERWHCDGEEDHILNSVPYGKQWWKDYPEKEKRELLYPLKESRNTAHMHFRDACCKTCTAILNSNSNQV